MLRRLLKKKNTNTNYGKYFIFRIIAIPLLIKTSLLSFFFMKATFHLVLHAKVKQIQLLPFSPSQVLKEITIILT